MLIEGFYQAEKIEDNKSNELIYAVHLNKDHKIYAAHFPGNPITPGVCTIQILKDIICEKFNKTLVFNHIVNVKFLNVINPLETPTVNYVIKYSQENESIKVNVVVKNTEKVFTKISGFFNEL